MTVPNVFIYELSDLAPPEWSGLVSAEFYDAGGSFQPGPEEVDVDEAVAWGRERASIVTIRLDGVLYCAGTTPQPGEIPWTSDVIRPYRRPSYQARDRPAERYVIRTTFGDRYTWGAVREGLTKAGMADITRVSNDPLVVQCVAATEPGGSLHETFNTTLEGLPAVPPAAPSRSKSGVDYEYTVLEPAG